MSSANESGPPRKPAVPPPGAKQPPAAPNQPDTSGTNPPPAQKPPPRPAGTPASTGNGANGQPKPQQPPRPPARPAQPGSQNIKPAPKLVGQAPAGTPAKGGATNPPKPGSTNVTPAKGGTPAPPPPKTGAADTATTATPPGAQKPGVAPAKPGAAPAKPAAAPQAGQPARPPADAIVKKVASKRAKDKSDSSGGRRKLGQVLVDLGFLDEDQLFDILDEARNTGQLTGQVAVSRGLITNDQLLQALGEQYGLKVVNLDEMKPQSEATQLVPESMAQVYKVVPLTLKDKVLTVAVGDPNHLAGLDDMRNLLGMNEVNAVLVPSEKLPDAIIRFYQGKEESIVDLIAALEKDETIGRFAGKKEASIDMADLIEITESAPVRKLINMVFLLAIRDHASDIHFEPFEEEFKMRYRCDGVLYEMVPPPRHLASAITSRIKVMANLDISERRLPQDGRIELNIGGNPVDMRVSILPTMFGESTVIRVLDRTVVSLDLNKIGMSPGILQLFRGLINKPNGIILVTGPTGAGKTTTLYSALNELNVITDKLITTEDPIEYEIEGLLQVPINSDIGVTFAAALRAILRHDPDKILVGEIRDLETAQIAIQASLTGHTVFSTLHTNDAPSTITRLRDMGVEPFLITATLEGILAQRLVRRICVDCRTEYEPSPKLLMELNLRPQDVVGRKFYYGRGCDRCNNTGHKGRMGLFELLTVNDDIRDLISKGTSTDQLRTEARKMGMPTLRESGLEALYAGQTTIDEVVRETVLEDEV
jgi:type IV pilus assembly protein PilB